MVKIVGRHSVIRLWLELVEEIVVLIFLELKRAVHEIRENVNSVEKGALLLVLGAGALFFASLACVVTAIAVLSLFLSTWLSALIVTAALGFLGIGLVFTGLADFKHFTLVPEDTLHRLQRVFQQYKKVAKEHHDAGRHEAEHHEAEQVRTDPELRRRAPGRGHTAE